ncbi:hypothetical protein ACNUDM_20915 [Vibrio chaetopteri]|uniref:hypothetical protein n=1 Tax=Vibrio chaetopteri TaxID=3016528 RepID=UPI003AB32CD8
MEELKEVIKPPKAKLNIERTICLIERFDKALALDNLPNLIGTNWLFRQEKEWLKATQDYDFSVKEGGTYNEDDIQQFLADGDLLKATRATFVLAEWGAAYEAFGYACLFDNSALAFSIICAEILSEEGELEYSREVYSDYLEYCLLHEAENVFRMLLLVPGFNPCDDIGVTAELFNNDSDYYRSLDWLLTDKYQAILAKFPVPKDMKVLSPTCCDDGCKVNLFAALILEGKKEQAKQLIDLGWDCNPYMGHQQFNLLEFIGEEENKEAMALFMEVAGGKLLQSIETLSDYVAYSHHIEELDTKAKKPMENLASTVLNELSWRTPYEQFHTLTFTMNLLSAQGDYTYFKPKAVSVLDDIHRLNPMFLKPYITNFTVFQAQGSTFVFDLYEYGGQLPKKRATLNMAKYQPFSDALKNTKTLTPFQIQLAFHCLEISDVVEIMDEMKVLNEEDCLTKDELVYLADIRRS